MARSKPEQKDPTTVESLANIVNDHAKRLHALEKARAEGEDELRNRVRELEQAIGLTPNAVSAKKMRGKG